MDRQKIYYLAMEAANENGVSERTEVERVD